MAQFLKPSDKMSHLEGNKVKSGGKVLRPEKRFQMPDAAMKRSDQTEVSILI